MPSATWLNAQFIEVDGSGKPGSFDESGETNDVAAIRISSHATGQRFLIEGRPEQLLELGRDFVRTAELIIEQTMRDPELRRLYGLTEVEHAE